MRRRNETKQPEQAALPTAPARSMPTDDRDARSDAGGELNTAIETPKQEPPPAEPTPSDLLRRELTAEVPDFDDRYEPVIHRVFDLPNPDKVYTRVEEFLKFSIRASRMDYGSLTDALNDAQLIVKDATSLLVNAKIAARRFEIDSMPVASQMHLSASRKLEQEKDQGLRKKAITNDDIEAAMASMYPDEWRAFEMKKEQNKRLIQDIEGLYERAKERARDIRAMVVTVRS